jgi:hypothetical protein
MSKTSEIISRRIKTHLDSIGTERAIAIVDNYQISNEKDHGLNLLMKFIVAEHQVIKRFLSNYDKTKQVELDELFKLFEYSNSLLGNYIYHVDEGEAEFNQDAQEDNSNIESNSTEETPPATPVSKAVPPVIKINKKQKVEDDSDELKYDPQIDILCECNMIIRKKNYISHQSDILHKVLIDYVKPKRRVNNTTPMICNVCDQEMQCHAFGYHFIKCNRIKLNGNSVIKQKPLKVEWNK